MASRCDSDESLEVDDDSIDSLAEMFRCCICLDKLVDASICPHCSKMFCFQCIHKWLTVDSKDSCPYCRAMLHINDVVKCRWGKELVEQLDALRAFSKKTTVKKCDRHGEKLSVFCEACDICICHQCALWTGEHHSHVFRPVDEVYQEQMKSINDLIAELRKRHCELIGSMQAIKRNIDNVQRAKDQRVREMRNAVEEMISHLETQLKCKLESLNTQRIQLQSESEKLDSILKENEHRKKVSSKSEMVEKAVEVKESLQEFLATNQPKLETVSISTDFQSEIIPNYDVGIFQVRPFLQKRKKAVPVFSDIMQASGLAWRLKVYPDGNGVVRGNYLSVFLELHSGFHESSKYEYKIELLHPHHHNDSSKSIIREFASEFEPGECWGYNRFYRLDLLAAENFLNKYDDSITLRFQVRSPNYYQKSRDLEAYIKQLENSNNQLRKEVTDLKESSESSRLCGATASERDVAPVWTVEDEVDEDVERESIEGDHEGGPLSPQDHMTHLQNTMKMVMMHAELATGSAISNEEDANKARETINNESDDDQQIEQYPLDDSLNLSDCININRLPNEDLEYSTVAFSGLNEQEGNLTDVSNSDNEEQGACNQDEEDDDDVKAFLNSILDVNTSRTTCGLLFDNNNRNVGNESNEDDLDGGNDD